MQKHMAGGKSNFSTFLKDNIESAKEKLKRKNQMNDFKKYIDDPVSYMLGVGAFGIVF